MLGHRDDFDAVAGRDQNGLVDFTALPELLEPRRRVRYRKALAQRDRAHHANEAAAVDRAMQRFYGLDPYRTVAPKAIWHHDTWGKPCDPDTLIVVDFPENDPLKHRQANDTVDFYATLESPWGRPYEILRLPMFRRTPGIYRPPITKR